MNLTRRFGIALVAAAAGLLLSLAYIAARGFEITMADLFVIQFAYVAAYIPAVAVAESYMNQRLGLRAAGTVA